MLLRLIKEKFSSKSVITFKCLVLFCLVFIIFSSYINIGTNIRTNSSISNGSSTIYNNKFMCRHKIYIEEPNKNIRSTYYRHATDERNTSYPLISGDTYRAFADFVFDETRQDDLSSVRYGDSVFVKADMFHQFFGQPYQSIKHPFVLITHNSDYSAPSDFGDRLKDEKILVWYASNPDKRNHPKLIPIPIGLANTRWPGGNLAKLMYAFENHRKPWANRTILLYANFNLNTNPGHRQKARAQAEAMRHAHTIRETVSFEKYLEHVGNSKFVLSPPGNGLDCHRTWEALLLGAAPVVLSSELDPLFEQIPSVMIDDWSKLTEDLLLKYNFSSFDNFTPTVLHARYWYERILGHHNQTS